MKKHSNILSIPPYISVPWENVFSLKAEETTSDSCTLHITLNDDSIVSVPNLNRALIDTLFDTHANFCEKNNTPSPLIDIQELLLPWSETKTFQLQHDPEKKDSPPLPPGFLDKITELSQTLGLQNLNFFSTPEEGCHCPSCQIYRAFHPETETEEAEELIKEEDLLFSSWIIEPLNNEQYRLTHPDNLHECYLVNLSPPIGCTCGSTQCEHIFAVLNT